MNHTRHPFALAHRGLLALVLVMITIWGCAEQPAQRVPTRLPRAVQVAQAERSQRSVVTEVVGTVRAVRSATVAPLISGTVAELRVGLGSAVRSGQVLVKLSAREVNARLEQATVALALAQLEHDRSANLRKQGAISAAEHDAAISEWNLARARQLEASSIAEHAVLRAPFAGVVAAKLTNVGDTALPGQPLLVLEAPGALRFEARVPEAAADGLAIGGSVPVRLDGFDEDIDATIAEIQPASDDATRTRLTKLDLPPTPGLRSGRFGRLLLATGATLAVSVPVEAVVRHGQLEGVFVMDSGIARLRLIRSGRERNGRLEIASGLAGDEQVVRVSAADLVDGQRVEVVQ